MNLYVRLCFIILTSITVAPTAFCQSKHLNGGSLFVIEKLGSKESCSSLNTTTIGITSLSNRKPMLDIKLSPLLERPTVSGCFDGVKNALLNLPAGREWNIKIVSALPLKKTPLFNPVMSLDTDGNIILFSVDKNGVGKQANGRRVILGGEVAAKLPLWFLGKLAYTNKSIGYVCGDPVTRKFLGSVKNGVCATGKKIRGTLVVQSLPYQFASPTFFGSYSLISKSGNFQAILLVEEQNASETPTPSGTVATKVPVSPTSSSSATPAKTSTAVPTLTTPPSVTVPPIPTSPPNVTSSPTPSPIPTLGPTSTLTATSTPTSRPTLPFASLYRASVGNAGGFADAGLNGEYFANSSFSGSPSFARKELRLDFDSIGATSPGGSINPKYKSVGPTNFSVRWSGNIRGRFNERYMFKASTNGATRVFIKSPGSTGWDTVIDQAASSNTVDATGVYRLLADTAYDIKVEYVNASGPFKLKLFWSSPSHAEEVIDAVAQIGIQVPDLNASYANIIQGARNSWEGVDGNGATTDAVGWPTSDCGYYFQESLNQGLPLDPLMRGLITFSLKGKADIGIQGNVDRDSLIFRYNASSNTTTGTFKGAPTGWNASFIYFRNTSRTGQVGGPKGFTDLKLMRPLAPDATTSYSSDEIFTSNAREAAKHFTVIRHQIVSTGEKDWADRTPPLFFNQSAGLHTPQRYSPYDGGDNGMSLEYKILLSNETGRDIMLSLPPLATDDYLRKVALVLKYGSDGVNPYTSLQANPVYPPLNSNLRVYFEIGNELWNYASAFWNDFNNINKILEQDARANNADFALINYDHQPVTWEPDGSLSYNHSWRYRKIILRVTQISDIFRGVFGDAAMHTHIRPLYEWMYNNIAGTAEIALDFTDKVLNNADGIQHVQNPHPTSYWIWGGGGASYYGAQNSYGLSEGLVDTGFDQVVVPEGYNRAPAGTSFLFTGDSGIARKLSSGGDIPPPFDGNQMGYITDTGSISFQVTLPAGTSNLYAVVFKALGRGSDRENIKVYLDDTTDITAKTFSQGDGYSPYSYDAGHPWLCNNVFWSWSNYFSTKSFTAQPGSTHKITFKGRGDISNTANTNQRIFLEDVHLSHTDNFYDQGFLGGGQATGQVVGASYQQDINGMINWAKAYGLEELMYEGGWSLGGDDGGSSIQLKAKYGDSRTRDVEALTHKIFQQAGGAVNVRGTYAQWPNWADFYAEQGFENIGKYPIVQGIDQALNSLSVIPNNGTRLPATLFNSNITLKSGEGGAPSDLRFTGSWISWNVVVPSASNYSCILNATGSGSIALLGDDRIVITQGRADQNLSGNVALGVGLHSIKIRNTGAGQVSVHSVVCRINNSPAAPILAPLSYQSGAIQLQWSAVPGATGYIVQYGTTPGIYSTVEDAGSGLTYTVNNLRPGVRYYFAVASSSDKGFSLPSEERGALALAQNVEGELAIWDFAGSLGTETSAPIRVSVPPISGRPIVRGPGLIPDPQAPFFGAGRFTSGAPDCVYGVNLGESVSKKHYYEIVVEPGGKQLALSSLTVAAFFQNNTGTSGLTYSIDGVTFANGPVVSGNGSMRYEFDLRSIDALQHVTAPITFRFYNFAAQVCTTTGLGDKSGSDVVVRGKILQ